MPLNGEAMPRPKSVEIARGEKKYRRKVASPKQWQAIIAAKVGPCRVCGEPGSNGKVYGKIQMHHVVKRGSYHGDDVADNLVPLCPDCHTDVTLLDPHACWQLFATLTDEEYSYAVLKCGENYFERAYGIAYTR